MADTASQTQLNDLISVNSTSQATSAQVSGSNIDMLMDVTLNVTVELGRTEMSLRQILDLQQGSVVELDRLAGEAVDIFVNDRQVAMGEVVVVDDKFGVRITELVSKQTK
ncbi:MAG TPA: flagellar motor switch protein FliN [Anaerolineaceae bacterium]|nr:flagellar motor switch protein FliN [Anaerolineaceae bacterium]